MTTTTQYLDAVKSRTGAASDYALAPIIGVTRAQISIYRKGSSFLGDETALKVAKILEIDSGIVLAAVHAERAKGDGEKAAWKAIFEKLGGLAASVVVGISLSSPAPLQAAEKVVDVYYVKSRRRLNPNPFLQILQPFLPAV